jgi:hypothetical protein
MEIYTCNPSYLGGKGKRIESLRLVEAKLGRTTPPSKKKRKKHKTKGWGTWL